MKKLLLLTLLACMALTGTGAQKAAATKNAASTAAKPKAVAYDLTRFSATMVYSTVFDMMMEPQKYVGKKIRIRGTFDVFEYEDSRGKHQSYACIVKDATACCAQGMEFVLESGKSYPQDYPGIGSDCTVTGTFQLDEVDGMTYIRLVDSVLG